MAQHPHITQENQHLAEMSKLDFLIGEWQNSGKVSPGPFGPGGLCTGTTTYSWEMNKRWQLYKSFLTLPGLGAYEVRGGVSFDTKAQKYSAFAFNSMGVLLVYDGTWEDEKTLIFDLVFPNDAKNSVRSRVVYKKHSIGKIQMTSERSINDAPYEAYFETILSAQPSAND
jgi:hypothetical protein